MVPVSTHTAAPLRAVPAAPGAFLQDRLAGWVSDLTTLHELTERLAATRTLDSALHETLGAGAALVGARRGLLVLDPADGAGPSRTIGLGLAHAELGHIETVPRSATPHGRFLDGLPVTTGPLASPDILGDPGLDPRCREVATGLGYAASYALPLATEADGRLGVAVWLYDEPAEPLERQCHLAGLYTRYATAHLFRLLELERTRADAAVIAEELLPSVLPRVPGCGSPPAIGPPPRAAATGTTRCPSRTVRSAWQSARSAVAAHAPSPPWAGSAPDCGPTPSWRARTPSPCSPISNCW